MDKTNIKDYDLEESRMSIRKTIAENIRRQRKVLGLTQAALAEKTGMTTETIGKIETLKQALSEESLIKITLALNITPGILFNNPETDSLIRTDFVVSASMSEIIEVIEKTKKSNYKSDHSQRR